MLHTDAHEGLLCWHLYLTLVQSLQPADLYRNPNAIEVQSKSANLLSGLVD